MDVIKEKTQTNIKKMQLSPIAEGTNKIVNKYTSVGIVSSTYLCNAFIIFQGIYKFRIPHKFFIAIYLAA